MSAPVAFCPQCKNEVAFIAIGDFRRCPLCGFQYETGKIPPGLSEPSAALSFLGVVLRFILILFAILAVVVGIVFIGCVTAFKW